MRDQKGDIYFIELAEKVEYGNFEGQMGSALNRNNEQQLIVITMIIVTKMIIVMIIIQIIMIMINIKHVDTYSNSNYDNNDIKWGQH